MNLLTYRFLEQKKDHQELHQATSPPNSWDHMVINPTSHLNKTNQPNSKGSETMTTVQYVLHMPPLTVGMLGLPCRPYSGSQQLISGDYYFVGAILGVHLLSHMHLRLCPTFFDADLCT